MAVPVLGARWQTQIHRLIGPDPPPRAGHLLVLPIAAASAAGRVGRAHPPARDGLTSVDITRAG